MIEAIIGLVLALIGGAFLYGQSSGKRNQTQSDLDATLQSKRNHEKISQMDDDAQLAEFDRLRTKRRKLL